MQHDGNRERRLSQNGLTRRGLFKTRRRSSTLVDPEAVRNDRQVVENSAELRNKIGQCRIEQYANPGHSVSLATDLLEIDLHYLFETMTDVKIEPRNAGGARFETQTFEMSALRVTFFWIVALAEARDAPGSMKTVAMGLPAGPALLTIMSTLLISASS